jgi:dihydropteroate synthase
VLDVGARSVIMGILNVTPDSFSDGGRYGNVDAAVAAALEMAGQGASIIDIGGESTRPGAEPVNAAEEQDRVLPVIEALASQSDVLISIDTYRGSTASLALEAGSHIINDVWGLHRDPEKAELAAATGAGLVIMHSGRERGKLPDVIDDQVVFLDESLRIAQIAKVSEAQIMLDPGFGFAKNEAENLALIDRFGELHRFGYPQLVGTSRKRFLGSITGRDAEDRDDVTAASSVLLRMSGASVFRVHNVAKSRDALALADAIIAQRTATTELVP